jgi:hypothetical protein
VVTPPLSPVAAPPWLMPPATPSEEPIASLRYSAGNRSRKRRLTGAENSAALLTRARNAPRLDGDLPVNPSGGVLSGNPTGASGMIRFAEAALQVRGLAGEHQVEGARLALGHAYGGGAQFFSMWLVGADRPER